MFIQDKIGSSNMHNVHEYVMRQRDMLSFLPSKPSKKSSSSVTYAAHSCVQLGFHESGGGTHRIG